MEDYKQLYLVHVTCNNYCCAMRFVRRELRLITGGILVLDTKSKVSVVCVCVFSSHLFWTSSSLDVPAGVTQEEGHTGLLTHLLPCAVHIRLFFSRKGFSRSFPSSTVKSILCTNDYLVLHLLGFFFFFFFFGEEKSQLPGFELTSQRVRRLRGYQLSYRGDRCTVHVLITYLKKNQNAPRPSEHPPVRGGEMSKRLGGIKGCKYKTSS